MMHPSFIRVIHVRRGGFVDWRRVMQILGKLFGGEERVRILRLFLFNPSIAYDKERVMEHSRVNKFTAKHELKLLKKIQLIKQKSFLKTVAGHPRARAKRKRVMGFVLNESFPYLIPLQNLLLNTALVGSGEILRRLGASGKLKLVITAGTFIQDADSRLDLLVVGDHLRHATLVNAIKVIEAEIGKELRYAFFDTATFTYRLRMYDKLIRDILDYPHRTILDKIGLAAPV